MEKNEIIHESSIFEEQSKSLLLKQQVIFDQQQKDVQACTCNIFILIVFLFIVHHFHTDFKLLL